MSYLTFVNPRTIFYGPGALESLSRVDCQRVMIVSDPGVRDLGLIDRVEKILGSRSAETSVFDQVDQNPSRETVRKIFEMAREFRPDAFIGLGGGSAIDAGKAAWLLYEHPELAEMHIFDIQKETPKRRLRGKAKYIAVSTTSGTGSEVTGATVITDREMKPPLKVGLVSPELKPDIAIADPELAASMPPSVTANTGFDALVHAIECYVLIPASDMIDPLCIWPARTVWKWLPEAVANGGNMIARDKMHLASLQAGIAFSNGRLGSIHVLSHELSAIFGVPHGRANAFMLCCCFAHMFPTHAERLADLSKWLGFEGKDDREKVDALLQGLDRLKQAVGIPLAMKEEIDEALFNAQLEPLVESYMSYMGVRLAALSPDQRRAGGWPATEDEVKTLYTHAWRGTRVELK